MSALVKLSAAMPGDPEINGVDAWAEWLENNPDDLLVAVVYLDTKKVTIDTDTGDHVPTVRVRRIEPLGPISGVSATVRKAVAAAEQERTGRSPLPFEIVEVGEHRHSDTLDQDGDDR